jgi:triosephosphate isomerase
LTKILCIEDDPVQRSVLRNILTLAGFEVAVTEDGQAALNGISGNNMANVVIAYEPIWAIGTGKNASGEIANQIIATAIRSTVRLLYGDAIAGDIRIQYGGSVKPNNMAEYMSQPDIDGALVGGASLNVNDFTELIRIAAVEKGG